MTLFIENVLISNRCISGLMPNLIKKSWTDSSAQNQASKERGKKEASKSLQGARPLTMEPNSI